MRVRQVVRRRRDRAVVDRVRLLDAAAARRNGDGRRASASASRAGAVGARATALRVGARCGHGTGRRRRRIFFGNIIHFGRRFRCLRLLRDGCSRNCAAAALLVEGAFGRRRRHAFVISKANFTGRVVAAGAARVRCATTVTVTTSATTGTGAVTATAADVATAAVATATVIVIVILIRTVIVIGVGGGARQRRAGVLGGGCRGRRLSTARQMVLANGASRRSRRRRLFCRRGGGGVC